MYVLYLKVAPEFVEIYEKGAEAYLAKPFAERDAGFDLYCPTAALSPQSFGNKLNQGISAAFYDTIGSRFRAYWLLPRSSIVKTHLRLANSVGLIDAGYRGPILAVVDNHQREDDFVINHGDRYFQLATPDLLPWDDIKIVEEIPGGPTLRGEGGFGSTGRSVIEALRSPSSQNSPNSVNFFM